METINTKTASGRVFKQIVIDKMKTETVFMQHFDEMWDQRQQDVLEKFRVPTYWYLASPYSKYPFGVQKAYDAVRYITAYFISKQMAVYSPINHSHDLPVVYPDNQEEQFHFWEFFDLAMVKASSGLLVAQLPGWDTSYGVRKEIDFALENKKRIIYLNVETWPYLGQLDVTL